MIGEIGQLINHKDKNGEDLHIGDAVKLINRKSNIACNYQIFFNEHTLTVELVNENNKVASRHPAENYWHKEAYHKFSDIKNGNIPYIDIIRLGDFEYSKKNLKKIKGIKNIVMKPY